MAAIVILPAAGKYFKKLKDKHLKKLFEDTINNLKENPYLGERKHGDLEGIFSCDIFYNKTNYELAYRVYVDENGNTVVVIMAGTRENFYEELKRYMKKGK